MTSWPAMRTPLVSRGRDAFNRPNGCNFAADGSAPCGEGVYTVVLDWPLIHMKCCLLSRRPLGRHQSRLRLLPCSLNEPRMIAALVVARARLYRDGMAAVFEKDPDVNVV